MPQNIVARDSTEAGTHTLRFEKLDARSEDMRSIDFKEDVLTLEYLVLLRLEDMAGYHEVYNEKKGAP